MRRWTRSEIEMMLMNSDLAVERAICALFRQQTMDERAALDTRHLNGRGFSAAHARTGSRFATWMTRGSNDGVRRRGLGGRCVYAGALRFRLDVAREIAMRYAGQLVDIANARERQAARERVGAA